MKTVHSYIIFYKGVKSYTNVNGVHVNIPNEYYDGRIQIEQGQKISGIDDLKQLEQSLKTKYDWSSCCVSGIFYIGETTKE